MNRAQSQIVPRGRNWESQKRPFIEGLSSIDSYLQPFEEKSAYPTARSREYRKAITEFRDFIGELKQEFQNSDRYNEQLKEKIDVFVEKVVKNWVNDLNRAQMDATSRKGRISGIRRNVTLLADQIDSLQQEQPKSPPKRKSLIVQQPARGSLRRSIPDKNPIDEVEDVLREVGECSKRLEELATEIGRGDVKAARDIKDQCKELNGISQSDLPNVWKRQIAGLKKEYEKKAKLFTLINNGLAGMRSYNDRREPDNTFEQLRELSRDQLAEIVKAIWEDRAIEIPVETTFSDNIPSEMREMAEAMYKCEERLYQRKDELEKQLKDLRSELEVLERDLREQSNSDTSSEFTDSL